MPFPKAEVERLLALAEDCLPDMPACAEAYAHIAEVWATLWVAQQ